MTVQSNLKDDYLEEMGVTRWYPRVHLINALPTAVLEVEPPANKAIVDSNQDKHQLGESSLEQSQESVGNKPDVVVAKTQTEALQPKEELSTKTGSAVESVKFGLGVYVIGEYLIASSLASNHEAMQEQAWRLMQNILRTLTKQDNELSYHHTIVWPFFDNKNADQSLSSAKTYVDDFINHLSEEHKTKMIIAFGGVLPKLKSWTPNSETYDSKQHLVLPSLYKMLANPAEKAKAWQLIKSSPFYNA